MINRDPTNRTPRPVPSIADPYWDLLARLDEGRRLGMVRRLAVGFYEGWLPSRDEVALLVDAELGRITQDEFLGAHSEPRPEGSSRPPPTNGYAGNPTGPEGPAGRPSAVPGGRGEPERDHLIAAIRVDCGELAPPFRLIATRLSSTGWTLREGKNYRLMALHYQLVPATGPASGADGTLAPVTFSAPIQCIPDAAAPYSKDDGSEIHHTAGLHSVAGSRGRWPIAGEVNRISFLIGRQPAGGMSRTRHPAGTLRVDLQQGLAFWRRVGA